jgi:D-alanyl-lipoteichoic acid acyltransferase DltB (MBOAT superfamily)
MNWISGDLFAWAAAFLAASWGTPRRWHPHVMAVFGMAFLGVHDWRSASALAGLALASHFLVPGPGVRGWRVAVVTLAVAALIGWTRRVGSASALPGSGADAVAFLGLSYYGLRIIHVAFDRYRGSLRAASLGEYAGYLAFFPAVIAGPIHRFREFLHDQDRRRWDAEAFSTGLERILYGIAKIVVLGNYLLSREAQSALAGTDRLPAWAIEYVGLFIACWNGYFQFAGYSDIALGLGNLAGYRLPENFNWPFFATNLRDFWQRWHMTLSQWCRDYVFTPATSRFRSPYAGVVLSMVILALWHELSVRYLLWGLWQAAGIAAWHAFQSLKPRLPEVKSRVAKGSLAVASCLLTLNYFVLSYALIRSSTMAEAWHRLTTVLLLKGGLHV